MNEALINKLNELISELSDDGYFVTVLVTGKNNDLELSSTPSRSKNLFTGSQPFLH